MSSKSSHPSRSVDKHQALQKYLNLPQPDDKILATYIWIDSTGENMRSKTMTIGFKPKHANDLPWWNFDGSSTNQSGISNSDVYLKPCAIFRDPFLHEPNILVLCETYNYDKTPTETNHRYSCLKVMEAAKESEPWFGIEQEYSLMDLDGWPLDWPKPDGHLDVHGPYYCSIGADRAHGRDISDAHYKACVYAGVKVSGSNAEWVPSQWEFQVGPLEGIDAGDHLCMGRYILHRVAEDFGALVTFHPKPFQGSWAAAEGHVNYSTKQMRDENGIKYIDEAVDKLSKRHAKHIQAYFSNSELVVNHKERFFNFTVGVADRESSVRIPRSVSDAKKGYLEDRRAASNLEPYSVCEMLVRTTVLNERDD